MSTHLARLIAARRVDWDPYALTRSRLRMWLSAKDYSWRMTDAGSGLLSSWKDRINSLDFTAAGSARPTYGTTFFNTERPAVRFDGVANCLVNTAFSSILPSDDYTILILASVNAQNSVVAPLFSFGGTAAGTNRQIRKDGSNRLNMTDGTASLSGTTNNSLVGPHLIYANWAGTTMTFRRDGGTALGGPTTFGNTAIGSSRIRIGASNGTTAANFCSFDLAEMIVIEGSLSQTTMETLEYFIARGYDLDTLLATTHRLYFGPGAAAAPAPPPTLPAYFKPADSVAAAAAGLSVFMNRAPPPSLASDETTFANWPGTHFATQEIDQIIASTSTWHKWGFCWIDRADALATAHVKKANPIFPSILMSGLTGSDIGDNGKACRASFDTYDKALAAAKVKLMHLLGYTPTEYQAVAVAAGFSTSDILAQSTLAAAPATYFTERPSYANYLYRTMLNKIWLYNFRLADAADFDGVFGDYECQDGRSAAFTRAAAQDIAAIVHAKSKLWGFYTNRLDGPGAPYSGIDASNAPDIYAASDVLGILLQAGTDMTASFAAQKAIAGGVSTKLAAVLDCSCSLAEAQTLRTIMVSESLSRLWFWPNGQPFGGADPTLPTNQKINATVFGV